MRKRRAVKTVATFMADALSDDAPLRYTPEQIAAAVRYDAAMRRYGAALEAVRRVQ